MRLVEVTRTAGDEVGQATFKAVPEHRHRVRRRLWGTPTGQLRTGDLPLKILQPVLECDHLARDPQLLDLFRMHALSGKESVGTGDGGLSRLNELVLLLNESLETFLFPEDGARLLAEVDNLVVDLEPFHLVFEVFEIRARLGGLPLEEFARRCRLGGNPRPVHAAEYVDDRADHLGGFFRVVARIGDHEQVPETFFADLFYIDPVGDIRIPVRCALEHEEERVVIEPCHTSHRRRIKK